MASSLKYKYFGKFVEQLIKDKEYLSLRQLANIFNTSHSQIKRMLKKLDIYDDYVRLKSYEIIDKPNMQVAFLSDIHIGEEDKQAIEYVIQDLKRRNIDVIVLGGDIIDNDSISYWGSRRDVKLIEEIEATKEFLAYLRENFMDATIYFIKGNHSERIEKYLINNASQLKYLDQLTIPNLLKLADYGIYYIDNQDEIETNGKPFHLGNLYYLHGHEVKATYTSVNIARTVFLKVLENVIFGHFHKTQDYYHKTLSGDIKGAWAVGCLCSLKPKYRPINNWNLGYAIIEYYKDDFIVNNINLSVKM